MKRPNAEWHNLPCRLFRYQFLFDMLPEGPPSVGILSPDLIVPPLPLLIEWFPVMEEDVPVPDFVGPLLSPAGPAGVDVAFPVAAPSAAKAPPEPANTMTAAKAKPRFDIFTAFLPGAKCSPPQGSAPSMVARKLRVISRRDVSTHGYRTPGHFPGAILSSTDSLIFKNIRSRKSRPGIASSTCRAVML